MRCRQADAAPRLIAKPAGPDATARPGLVLALLLLGSAAVGAETVDLRVEIRGGEVPRAQRVLKVRHEDQVRIEWRADRATVIHIEGHDLSVHADPGRPEVMEFKAFATGRFPVHVHEVDAQGGPARHGHHTRPLLRFEVHPK